MKRENIHIKTFSNKRRAHKTSAEGLSLFEAPASQPEEALRYPVKKDLLSSDQLGTLIESLELNAAISPVKKHQP